MRALAALVLTVTACGRIGFDVSPVPRDGAGATDAAGTGDAADSGGAGVAPWTLVQATGSDTGIGHVAATGAGHLIVVAAESINSQIPQVTDNAPGGSSLYVTVPDGRCTDLMDDVDMELWYTTASQPGATVIDAAGPVQATIVWEVSGLGSATLDAAQSLTDQGSSSMPVGPALSTTRAGDFVVQVIRGHDMITALDTAAFERDASVDNDGFAHLIAPQAPVGAYGAAWTQSADSPYCAVAAAFAHGE
jgi:hypothetical protein